MACRAYQVVWALRPGLVVAACGLCEVFDSAVAFGLIAAMAREMVEQIVYDLNHRAVVDQRAELRTRYTSDNQNLTRSPSRRFLMTAAA
jgi:hypothetical protein